MKERVPLVNLDKTFENQSSSAVSAAAIVGSSLGGVHPVLGGLLAGGMTGLALAL